MTRFELNKEMLKIEGMIDVLQMLTKTTQCLCTDINTGNFRQLNINELKMLLELQIGLARLKEKSDLYLEEVVLSPLLISYKEDM